MDLGLRGKAVVVTGGTSGIGLATARLLLEEEGANVALCGRDPERLNRTRDELSDFRDHVLAVQCDVLDEAAVARFREATFASFGQVQALICNAGQAWEGDFFTVTRAEWLKELELKFFAYVYPIRAFVDPLKASGHGSIVCINSTVSTQPEPSLITSSAARGGVLNLAKSLARALAPEIRVNSVALGPIASGQWRRRYESRGSPGQNFADWLKQESGKRSIPLGRFGQPEEAASAIAYLASPRASFITGARLEVSGGTTKHV